MCLFGLTFCLIDVRSQCDEECHKVKFMLRMRFESTILGTKN